MFTERGKTFTIFQCGWEQGWGRLQKPDYDYDYSTHKIIDYDYDYSGD